MTEQQSGSGTGNPSAANGGTNEGGNATQLSPDAGFFTGLQDADNRALVASKGWDKANSPDVVITSYRELEGRLGKSVVPPAANAPREDYDKFYAALGRPEKPDGYDYRLPEGVPENFPYDDGFATEYRNWSYEIGLNPQQSQALHDKFVLRAVKQGQDAATAQTAQVTKAHGEIVAKWGDPDGEGYKTNVGHSARALRKLGLTDTFKRHGLLTQAGEVTDSKLALALATIGAGLYTEDKDTGGHDPGSFIATNPWKDGQENVSEQGRLVKENPDLARSLIQAAGKDPDKVLWKRT